MRNIIAIILVLIPISLSGQIDKEIKDYPKPDCSSVALKTFFSDSDRINLYPKGKEINKVEDSAHIKIESQLTKEDYNKPIEIHFPINDYENWENLDIPITKTKTGFRYKNRDFSSINDAFMILSPTRYIISGNSQTIIDKVSNNTAPKYSITIIENGDFAIFADKNFEINLQKISAKNYTIQKSKFFQIKVSNAIKKFDTTLIILDKFVKEFCDSARLELPKQPVIGYFHSNPNVARLFSNHDWNDCTDMDDNKIFGTVKFDIIHALDFITLSHETVHSIWNSKYNHVNFLLNEGTATFFTLFQNYSISFVKEAPNVRQLFYNTIKSNLQYDFYELVINKDYFWSNPSISYAFAGAFCEFLIKKYGLGTYKTLYNSYENQDSFESIYKKPLHQLINDFKNYIENK